MESSHRYTMQYGGSTYPKVVYFYADGSSYGEGVRVVIHPNRFRSLEALLEFLTAKFPDLPYGVRSIFSPRGRTRIHAITELNGDGHYIASDKRHQAKGIQLVERSVLLPGWKTGRVSSGQKLLNYSLKPSETKAVPAEQQTKKQTTRVIYVHQNGNAFHRHRILIQGRAGNSLQNLLQELSFTLCEPVYKIYTLTGKEIQFIEEVFDGPEEYVAVGLEKLRPLSKAHINLLSKHHRPSERACIHHDPGSLRHRSAHSGPFKSRDNPRKISKNPSRPRSQEAKKENQSTTKGRSSGLHSSQSMFQLSSRKMKYQVPGSHHWLVKITTGRRDTKVRTEYTSACTANVFLTVQGTKSTSAALLLSTCRSQVTNGALFLSNKTPKGNLFSQVTRPLFLPGQTDEFEVNLGDIGEIVKVRLSHDNTGEYPELLVSHLRMTRLPRFHASMESGQLRNSIVSSTSSHSLAEANLADLTFFFNAWLSQNIGDGQVTREVASRASLGLILQEQRRLRLEALKRSQRITPALLVTEEPKVVMEDLSQLPTVQYHVMVKTSDLWNAGTAATVMILLLGQFGDSGPRHLWNRELVKRQPFQQGQVDEFKIQCVTLGRLNSLKVWLESSLRKTLETWCPEWIQVIEEDVSLSNISPSTPAIVRQPPTLFHGDQWLYSEPVANILQMPPILQPVDRIFGLDEESHYGFPTRISKLWKSMAWIFKNGMEISFYSLVTGYPLSMMSCGQVKSIKAISDSFTETLFTVRTTDYIVTARHRQAFVRSTLKKSQRTPNDAQDMTKIVLPVFQFALTSKPWLHLTLAEDGSLCGFLVRPQLDGFVQLESVHLRDYIERASKIRVDPSDGRVSVRETVDHKETLLMPFVKGLMRDQGIIMLCTNSEQTLIPRADEQSADSLIAMATGNHTNESHWRVHRVNQQIRAFESVVHCGHFLQIKEGGTVDVMGRGDSKCHFTVLRERGQGFIRLESHRFTGVFLYINSNGSVTSSNNVDNRSNRFYPLIVKFGKRRNAPNMSPSQSITLSESTLSKNHTRVSGSTLKSSDQDDSKYEEHPFNPNANTANEKGLLNRSETINKKLNKYADWKVQLHTSESAFNALIVLVVYGTTGNSGPIIIGTSDCEKCLFRAGNIDDFKVNLAGIGPIFKIRLEVNPLNESELPYWGLIKVVFENMVTQEQIAFDFTNRPFIRMSNHCQLSREQIRSGNPLGDPLPTEILSSDGLDPSAGLVLYRVKFYARAVSEAEQQIPLGPKVTLFGRYGDTGRRLIVLSDPFAKKLDNNLEVFECLLEAVYLGSLTHCLIGPISESPLEGRFCVGIGVADPMTGKIYRFPANVLIGSGGGGQIREVTIKPDSNLVLFGGLNVVGDTDDDEYSQQHESVTRMFLAIDAQMTSQRKSKS
ncbi:lipoxygenase domain containing protein [Echinococcus multilocularis]|uniref:Lipoxygenase domain containing protein n=1 Tax=Echinococcus multilocularis TaxID=6211 RepID=A0A068Y3Q6_ECHMU|nr:lipoxygenase domain containing protein [Echinococcus multilocularis]